MKQLVSIRLVQFFLYERLDIRIGKISGVFGPNGTGKSSLLDAVQIAMFGANSRLASFNAQADENLSNTRSMRSYCLGQFGDSENERVRDRATTYITLVWHDSETKEAVSMGVCLSASVDGDGHEVLGRYLLSGVELSMGDHLDLVNGREQPREWATFRHQLQERSKVSGEEPLFNDSERYMRAMLVALRGTSVPQFDAYTRAFRFALRMRFDKSVDQIVRYQVLETRPTNIKKFKEVTASFKRLSALVMEVQTKIDAGELVEKDYARAHDESRKVVGWKAMALTAKRDQAQDAQDKADLGAQAAQRAFDDALAAYAEKQAAHIHAASEAGRFKGLREQHSAHAESRGLQSQIATQRTIAQRKTQDLTEGLAALRKCVREGARSEFIKDSRSALAASVEALDGLLGKPITVGRDEMARSLRPTLKAVDAGLTELFHTRRQIENELESASQAVKDAEAGLARGEQGRAPLDPEVTRLLTELRDGGINATPVCDLVRVTDAKWQPAIEGYLGKSAQALLVDSAEESDALRIYRQWVTSRAVHGVKLARESRYLDKRSPAAGTVAELLEGTNTAAVNYLRSKFGGRKRCDTNEELLASNNALTADGLLASDGEIDRTQLVSPFKFRLGGGRPEQVDELKNEIRRLESIVIGIEKRKAAAKTTFEMLQVFAVEKSVVAGVLATLDARRIAEEAVQSLSQTLKDTASEEYVRLGEEELRWEERARTLTADLTDSAQAKGGADQYLKTCQSNAATAAERASKAAEEVHAARAASEFDHELANRLWDEALEKCGSDSVAMEKHCDGQAEASSRRLTAAANAGSGKLGQFLAAHREHVTQEVQSDWRKSRQWMLDLLKRLKDTELRNYTAQMEDAYRTSQATFRNDVALALNENLKWLGMTQERLNQVLRTCPVFSNGERYRFKRTTRPAYQALLRFIKAIAETGPGDDLFGGAGQMPDEFRALLEEKVAPGAGAVKSPLDDYREFFEFDIEILREHAGSREQKLVGHLSKRLGSGSGGEHRAPLYVIAGAALASAYRLESGNNQGMRLILLDEAFNKMDMANIIATMRYLEDLGLQVFMASPGENLGTLNAFLDRYFDILRDPERNVLRLQGHDVAEEVRAMFREDLPEFNPDLVAEEIRSMTAAEISGSAQIV